MRTRLPLLSIAALVAIVGVGCTSANDSSRAEISDGPVVNYLPTDVPEMVQEATAAEVAEEPEAEVVNAAQRSVSAPAPLDSFRADPLTDVSATGNPQLIEFFAFWCSVCRAARPTVHALEAEYWGQIDFVYLDIDDPENGPALDEYGFRAQPYFVFVTPEGEVINAFFGSLTEEEFRDMFDSYLAGEAG